MIERINIDGPLHVADGYSQMTRGLICAFARLGVEVHSETNWNLHPADPEPEIIEAISRGFDRSLPGIRLSQPDSFDACPGPVKIGYSMWEFGEMPRARWRDNHDGTLRPVKPWGDGANQANIVLAPCEHSRQLFINAGCTKPVHVVPLGYDRGCYYPGPADKPQVFTFITTGTLSGRKNPNLVYQAFTELFGDERHPAHLVLKSCAHLPIRLEPKANITIVNEDWPHSRLGDWYRALDVFVNPSQGEGFGLTNIEAMACGLPVIVTNWSAPVDYVDDLCGWLIDWEWAEIGSDFCLSDDPDGQAPGFPECYEWQTFRYAQPTLDALKDAMWDAYTNREATRQKGIAAAEKAAAYTWEDTARAISAILEGGC